jgi:hypothetical protein
VVGFKYRSKEYSQAYSDPEGQVRSFNTVFGVLFASLTTSGCGDNNFLAFHSHDEGLPGIKKLPKNSN